jgi:DNA-binding response OmpR family regulator
MLNKGIILTYEQLCLMIWNEEYDCSSYSKIKSLIQRLRGKITLVDSKQDEGIVIQNMRGVGYYLSAE